AGASAGTTARPPWLPHQQLEVPPLRGHPRDILALAELMLSELGTRPDGSPRLLTERAKRLLVTWSWPGNVRELRLVLESAAAQARNEPIAPRHLPPTVCAGPGEAANPAIPTLADVERQHIADVMQRTGGNRTRAAQILGIAPSTLYEKLKGDKPAG
ncbi:MAG: helix-turn-helix domain-containing protein, partial [Planctomycetota bacterium]